MPEININNEQIKYRPINGNDTKTQTLKFDPSGSAHTITLPKNVIIIYAQFCTPFFVSRANYT